jgi:hypothetical protein
LCLELPLPKLTPARKQARSPRHDPIARTVKAAQVAAM